jgi:hypothetical protein
VSVPMIIFIRYCIVPVGTKKDRLNTKVSIKNSPVIFCVIVVCIPALRELSFNNSAHA